MNVIALEDRYSAHNYHPLPVVLARGEGSRLWDIEGRCYIDMMSAYSAVSHGHGHPRILAVLEAQARRLAVPSRAFHNDRLGPFLEKLCKVAGLDAAVPMNTGAEAVETAIKAARRWGYRVKGIAPDRAEIVVAEGNFHGRTTTIIGFSSEPDYRDGFGPFAPGFRAVKFGDLAALERAITPDTAAVLVEPIQGEAGIIVPPAGWLASVRRLCSERGVLLILDEVQSGLGRTGAWFAFEHENVRPDGLILGKALGGGVLPVSAFLGTKEVMEVFTPGSHGSTFGGNALAAAVGLEALNVIEEEGLVERSRVLGAHMIERLKSLHSPVLKELRGRGLWVGAEIDPSWASAREICERLLAKGVLSKETHETVVRLAPPLVISREELDLALDRFAEVLGDLERGSATAVRPLDIESVLKGESKLMPTQNRSRILMGRPDHFAVTYSINPWMDPGSWASDDQALGAVSRQQWRALHRTLQKLGAEIEVIPAAPGLPDLVFTANAAVVMDGKALLARFRHSERQGEERTIERAFCRLATAGIIEEVHRLPEGIRLEGAGDCVWDRRRGMFWLGYGQRSDRAAQPEIERRFALETVALELADPRFYHMDTALSPLPGGELMYVPGAFTARGRAEIRARVAPDLRIELEEADAILLAANAVCVGHAIVLGGCSPGLQRQLEERGYQVHATPLDTFRRSGGSAFCLTLRLDHRSDVPLPAPAVERSVEHAV